MKWNKTITEPGYYWWKRFEGDSCIVIEIIKHSDEMFWADDADGDVPITELTGYFYGPLKEPKQTIRD